MGVTVAMSAD